MHKVVGSLHTGMYTMYPMYTVHCALYTVHCALYIVHCTLYIVHCTNSYPLGIVGNLLGGRLLKCAKNLFSHYFYNKVARE